MSGAKRLLWLSQKFNIGKNKIAQLSSIKGRRFLILLFGGILLFLIIFLPGYTKLQELKDRHKALEEKISKIELENTLLENEILQIDEDPVYQEEIIRKRLGVVRKGEVIYKIEPEE